MDIGSRKGYPSAALSNFAPHPFVFDGVECASMEGLLQSFKFEKHEIQKEVCKLVGLKAKNRGRGRTKRWKQVQTLWWNSVAYPRKSKEYQTLLNRAYKALSYNKKFQKALLATGDAILTHTIGKNSENETILTQREFCRRLTLLRVIIKLRKSWA